MENKINQNKDTLDELNKGCSMGMDAIKYTLDKVEDDSFKKVLENQYKEYDIIHEQIEKIYSNYSDENPTETNAMNKAMTWSSVEMKTLMDNSNSKIAELLLQGTNMGIIEGRKLLNHKSELDKDVEKILHDYVNMQENAVEILKEYL